MARGLSCSDQMMYLVVSCCLLLSASELNRVAQATGVGVFVCVVYVADGVWCVGGV